MTLQENGHHWKKAYGNTVYEGELGCLPYPASAPPTVEVAADALHSDGYVLFPGALSPEEVATLRDVIDRMGSPNDEDYVVPGWCYNKHLGADFHREPGLLSLLDRPGIVDAAERVLTAADGGDAHVIGGSLWVTGSGRKMGIHVDHLTVQVPEDVHDRPGFRMPVFGCTAHFYLDDMTEELGPTVVIPGSHRAGRPPRDESTWNGVAPLAAMVRAGDALLFRWDLWHGAWPNTHPTARRYMIQVHYATGTTAKEFPPIQYEDYYNPEVLAAATPRQRQMLLQHGRWAISPLRRYGAGK